MKRQNRTRNNFNIIKASGNPEPFSKKKLYTSIQRTGLSPKACDTIVDSVSSELNEGFKTRDIYRKALSLVEKNSRIAAAQYSLKRALFDLGPTGHNFETYVAKYFNAIGFKTSTCQIIQGKLVKHEVDVVGQKGISKIFAECKFHNRQGIKNDIKIALYVKARWDDLKEGPEGKNLSSFFLASNTSFSLDAIAYAKGSGLHLLGVNAPSDKSFLDEIKELGLYPITSLRRINRLMKNKLIGRGFILAKDLLHQEELLNHLGMTERDIQTLKSEIEFLTR